MKILNSSFVDNVSAGDGGAISVETSYSVSVENCEFKGNIAMGVGGEIIILFSIDSHSLLSMRSYFFFL